MDSRRYGNRYQAQRAAGSQGTAGVVAPLLIERYGPASVIDVGCGLGGWLQALGAAGVEDCLGVDGPWVNPNDLLIPPDRFRAMDLSRPFAVPGSFDVAISVEVAEHLPPERGAGFVADLVALAPVVVFSAAVPGQGGRGHVNERWQSEWAELFAEHGYAPHDVLRPILWSDPRVEWWYAQNLIVYERGDRAPTGGAPLDLVHPACLTEARLGRFSRERLVRGGARRARALRAKLVKHA